MTHPRLALWIVWAVLLVPTVLSAAIPYAVALPAERWHAGEAAVANFVAALFALAAAVGTFAIRESLAQRHVRSGALDPITPEGFARLRTALLLMWALCAGIAAIGLAIAVLSATPSQAVPYALGAAALLFLHRPHEPFFAPPTPTAV
jgi:hypothetical protein